MTKTAMQANDIYLKTGSLYNAIPEFLLAERPWYMSHYTMAEK